MQGFFQTLLVSGLPWLIAYFLHVMRTSRGGWRDIMSQRGGGTNPYSQVRKPSLKHRVAHGLKEFFSVFLFLAPFFLAFSTYRMLLLKRFTDEPFEYGTGLVNALILTKVIATGEFFHLGTRHENKPLIFSTIWKSFVFALLAAAFYVLELTIRGLIRGGGITAGVSSIQNMGVGELFGRSLVMLFAFVPFFALRETGRVLGQGKLEELFLRPRVLAGSEARQIDNRSANATHLGLERYQAILFDMDGVITDTASIHAACWKTMFDEFLQKREKNHGLVFRPFHVATDYKSYVDGKPRYNGVRDFLNTRGIVLPEGTPEDPPTADTVCALGNRKDELVNARLAEGVEAYPGSIDLLRYLRRADVKTAVVTSSQNCQTVLHAAGVEDLFDARVDGQLIAAEGLAGKPAPDPFWKAAEMLGVPPESAAVVEDAISGIQAGARGGFGLVIGVDRKGIAGELKANGAQIVVNDLAELLAWDFRQPLQPAA
jgi:beta-phosphoglucomutase family hydrolase